MEGAVQRLFRFLMKFMTNMDLLWLNSGILVAAYHPE
jgi:hypothetical protein